MKEVFILADDNHLALGGETPDLAVGGLSQAQVEDVVALRASRSQEPRQGRGKLVVDKESHETWSTG
jgi:hypothetical protein